MKCRFRLLFGPLAAAILVFGIIGLAPLVRGYSHVRQTVSEIGEVGSPARLPFTIMLCCVGACLLVFASAIRNASIQGGRSPLAAYLTACMAAACAGVGVFAFPHPLHNVFGASELIGYQAPLALALTWRRDAGARGAVVFSGIMAALVWLAIAMNLCVFDREGAIWAYLKPIYGLVQRSLFAAWFGWCVGLGILLFSREGQARPRTAYG